ncbi:MAG: DUF3348 domain-containing protein [Gammaproteobacteria bacterium]|jgi:hypothetical protein|nr:DUF3348 domain-containing protein [Gammaproteobacteria bacterium]MBU1505526.1 DUF3348 domain-containing protein [Gammaproteobacteria bacterium]MBU2120270.1 DUF3348 domain-containing protein [Gammaproteobacteria bacterium]MBU2170758.1 DUF3348 domain-containing protein [Gammaproteobacteria bacterium]MBU2199992.1 DUF3348 domain-containing protein [Gammaproteobacteria bacterium]
MYLHHPLNSSRLVVLLQQWARQDGERPGQSPAPPGDTDVAEQLAQWLGTVDAVKLSRALHAIETLPSEAGALANLEVVDLPALDRLVEKTKADLHALVTAKVAAPKPLRARADNTPVQAPDPQVETDYAAHGPRYLDLQKQIDTRLLAMRVQVRHALALGSSGLRQLAALDAVMEQMLGAREQRLWASLSGHLERRLVLRHHKHLQTLQNSGVADEPLRWRQPGGWLWAFEQDLQALLIAELQVRLLPITGLLEAAHHEKTGRQE